MRFQEHIELGYRLHNLFFKNSISSELFHFGSEILHKQCLQKIRTEGCWHKGQDKCSAFKPSTSSVVHKLSFQQELDS